MAFLYLKNKGCYYHQLVKWRNFHPLDKMFFIVIFVRLLIFASHKWKKVVILRTAHWHHLLLLLRVYRRCHIWRLGMRMRWACTQCNCYCEQKSTIAFILLWRRQSQNALHWANRNNWRLHGGRCQWDVFFFYGCWKFPMKPWINANK